MTEERTTTTQVTVVLRRGRVKHATYRLARWAWHVSSWFALLGRWLDEVSDRDLSGGKLAARRTFSIREFIRHPWLALSYRREWGQWPLHWRWDRV